MTVERIELAQDEVVEVGAHDKRWLPPFHVRLPCGWWRPVGHTDRDALRAAVLACRSAAEAVETLTPNHRVG